MRLAVAEEFRGGDDGARRRWRAGGILLQFLPKSPERARAGRSRSRRCAGRHRAAYASPKTTPGSKAARWSRRSTIIELIDPALSSERLAYRLFHERGVRVFRAAPVQAQCSCSRESVDNMLRSFPQDDRDDMVEDGKITVTCEFCSSTYVFDAGRHCRGHFGAGLSARDLN